MPILNVFWMLLVVNVQYCEVKCEAILNYDIDYALLRELTTILMN